MFFKVKDFSLQPKVLSLSNFKHKLVQICVCVSGWDNNPSVLWALYVSACYFLQGTLQQFVDDFFRSVLCSGSVVPPAVKYFFDFLDEQALRHDNVDEETLHIWKTNRWTSNDNSCFYCLHHHSRPSCYWPYSRNTWWMYVFSVQQSETRIYSV